MSEEKKAMPDETDDSGDEEREQERPEEQPRPEEKPAGPPRPIVPGALFNRAARAWVVLSVFCLAGIAYFVPPRESFLWKKVLAQFADTLHLRNGGPVKGKIVAEEADRYKVEVEAEVTYVAKENVSRVQYGLALRPSLIVAAAFFAVVVWLLFRFFGAGLDYHKPGQGRWVRLTAYVGMGLMAVFAGISVHRWMFLRIESGPWLATLLEVPVLGVTFTVRPIFFVAGTVFSGLLLGYHLFMNRARWVDYLIETQSELRKVSWPPHREWMGSAVVVVVVVAFISVFLFLADEGLSNLLKALKIGF